VQRLDERLLVRTHKTIIIATVCAVILVMMTMMSLTCVQKLSQGCLISHKAKVHANPCLRDSITSPSTTGVVALPASAPVVPEPMPACYAEVIGSVRTTIDPSIKTPPLRC
jgi:hypothetical protein